MELHDRGPGGCALKAGAQYRHHTVLRPRISGGGVRHRRRRLPLPELQVPEVEEGPGHQLSKNMQRLPGVPRQVEFADIRKATDNFHESTRLGQGGFGAVYRCRLPAAKKGGGEFMEVAVKKFTGSNNRGYEDFLAEVSIINRLRHKNIVPLVGKFISTVYISSICYEIYKSIVVFPVRLAGG